ncbi:NifB/NifX family molybdenum-iron cluster-binding protein [Athalassotoga saccharophila]|uniref:NifB/NifX family molybdenum-iron cluster-binding protein n=1 Tax=Athalassotoga saccharophila TaxID=1441386 RepID=UPI00137A65E6|nr:NifB/NifX family molybdenum-iron cluster-binding protein [Athalassotoga saccharophila]BBJ28982.1 dinitrogenase iron-molybdenum cofactor biosynthesis protein [Athalassotoga saccharophila]
MKIMLATDSPSLESKISDRFARTSYFLIYNLENGNFDVIDNSSIGSHGAGPKAVQIAMDNDVSAIISAIPGETAMEAVRESKIKVYDGRGLSAKDAIGKFKSGELKEI